MRAEEQAKGVLAASPGTAHAFPSPECPGAMRGPGHGQRPDLSVCYPVFSCIRRHRFSSKGAQGEWGLGWDTEARWLGT